MLSTLESANSYPLTNDQLWISQSTMYMTVHWPEDFRTGDSSEVVCEAWIANSSFFPPQDV